MYDKNYYENNKSKFKIWNQNYRQTERGKKSQLERSRKYEQTEKRKNWRKIYKNLRPEIYLKSTIKTLTKLGIINNMDTIMFRRALEAWSNQVKKENDYLCQICMKYANHAHHVFPKIKYPYLALNLNNGISLCEEHHKEFHKLNGWK